MKKMIKKVMTGLLVLCFVLSTISTTAFAQSNSKETYDLVIRTEKEFISFLNSMSKGTTYQGKTVKLAKDIEITANSVNDIELVYASKGFFGVFDGGCHTVSGIHSWRINPALRGGAALFGYIGNSGVVKNLYIDDFSFDNSHGGAFVIAVENKGLIENCRITNCNISGSDVSAGIVKKNDGKIINCSLEGIVASKGFYCNGIAYWNRGTISNSSFVGDVSTSTTKAIGCSAGISYHNQNGTIQNCYTVVSSDRDNDKVKVHGLCTVNAGILLNCHASDEGVDYLYDEDRKTVQNVNTYSQEDMKSDSFVNTMNSKLSGGFLKWTLNDKSEYPSLVDMYEVTFKGIDSKKGYVKSSKSYVSEGEKVTLTPVMNKKYKVSSITVKTTTGKNVSAKRISKGAYTFTMPDDEVVVTAKIVKKK